MFGSSAIIRVVCVHAAHGSMVAEEAVAQTGIILISNQRYRCESLTCVCIRLSQMETRTELRFLTGAFRLTKAENAVGNKGLDWRDRTKERGDFS